MGRKPSTHTNLPKGMRARARQRKHGRAVIYFFTMQAASPEKKSHWAAITYWPCSANNEVTYFSAILNHARAWLYRQRKPVPWREEAPKKQA